MDGDIDDPYSGVKVQKLGIDVLLSGSGVIGLHHDQVGSRPLGQHALGAPMKGMSIDKLGGLCACRMNIFPTLLVCMLFSSPFLVVSVLPTWISASRTS